MSAASAATPAARNIAHFAHHADTVRSAFVQALSLLGVTAAGLTGAAAPCGEGTQPSASLSATAKHFSWSWSSIALSSSHCVSPESCSSCSPRLKQRSWSTMRRQIFDSMLLRRSTSVSGLLASARMRRAKALMLLGRRTPRPRRCICTVASLAGSGICPACALALCCSFSAWASNKQSARNQYSSSLWRFRTSFFAGRDSSRSRCSGLPNWAATCQQLSHGPRRSAATTTSWLVCLTNMWSHSSALGRRLSAKAFRSASRRPGAHRASIASEAPVALLDLEGQLLRSTLVEVL